MVSRKGNECPECVMCSQGTIERRVKEMGKTVLLMSPGDIGITCGICNRLCCIKCLRKVVDVFASQKKQQDPWYLYVSCYIDHLDNPQNKPDDTLSLPFVGHCCELGIFKRGTKINSSEKTRFDGCLFLPEYKLIISPSFSSEGIVDIHGFGGMPPYFSGVVHCVPSHSACIEYEKKGVKATGGAACFRLLDNSTITTKFEIPYETWERKVSGDARGQ